MFGSNFFGQPYFGQGWAGKLGIQLDATANSGYQAASGSYSWTHVVGSGSRQILVVSVGLLSVTNSVTALTYNSVALTKLRSDVSASTTVRTEIWYLLAPATGSHSVAITLNTSSVSGASSTSLNNVDQTTPIDAQNGGTAITGGGGGSASIATATVNTGAWLVDAVATTDTVITVGSNQNERANITGAVGTAGHSSRGAIVTPASTTMAWDNVAALTPWTMSTFSVKPSVGAVAYTSSIAGTLSFSGSTIKRTTYPMSGTLSFVGVFTKRLTRLLTGTLSFSGAFSKSGRKVVAGTVSFVGAVPRAISYPLTATLSFTGSNAKRIARTLSGTLSFVGSFGKTSAKFLSALLPFSPSVWYAGSHSVNVGGNSGWDFTT